MLLSGMNMFQVCILFVVCGHEEYLVLLLRWQVCSGRITIVAFEQREVASMKQAGERLITASQEVCT